MMSRTKRDKPKEPRNSAAVAAHFRNSAGAFKDDGNKYDARKFDVREALADAELDQPTPEEMKELERNREDPEDLSVDEWQKTEEVKVPWWDNAKG